MHLHALGIRFVVRYLFTEALLPFPKPAHGGLSLKKDLFLFKAQQCILKKEKKPMKMQEVRQKAKVFHISSFGKTKIALIREIQRAEGNFDCFKTAAGYCDQWDCCFRDECLDNLSSPHREH